MTNKQSILGVVAALPAEAEKIAGRRGWRRQEGWNIRIVTVSDGMNLMCVCCGMGAENAFKASCWLIEQGISALAVLGVSGGLNPALKSGDWVVPEAIIEFRSGRPYREWGPESRFVNRFRECTQSENLSINGGSILTVPFPVLTRNEKTSLYSVTGAQAVDMESAAVARAASDKKLPMFALRTICDTAADDIAAEYLNLLNPHGAIRWPFLLAYLLRRPYRVVDLIRHGRRFSVALSALGRGWRLLTTKGLPGSI